MERRRGSKRKISAAVLASSILPCLLTAQSLNDRAAWNAMTLVPAGALAPLARDPSDNDELQPGLWLRYGRWKYDADDAIHNNIGLTIFHDIPLPLPASELSITGAYVSLSCANCPSWISSGASLTSTFWQYGERDYASGSVGIRADVGAAHYRGATVNNATSYGVAAVSTISVPISERSHLSATIAPGIGRGRIALSDGIHSGTRGSIGAAIAWIHSAGVAVDFGIQRILIARGPTQIGAGVGWSR